MKKAKVICAALSLMLAALLFSGCGVFTVNPERDRAQVVARINGLELTKGEIIDIADYYATYQGLKKTDADYKTALKKIREGYAEDLIKNKLILSHGKDYGITGLTADEQKQADDQYKQVLDTAKSTTADQLKEEGITNPTDEQINARLDQSYAENHTSREQIKKSAEESILLEKISDAMRNTVQDKDITEQQVKEYYDRTLSTQKSSYDATPSDFESAYTSGELVVYNLPGYRLVKQIFIPVSTEDRTKLDELSQKEDPTLGTVSQQALAKIKPTVDEVYAALKAGKTFDELITKYNKDTYMPEMGYAIAEKTDVSAKTESSTEEFYLADIKSAATKLAKPGDYTAEAVATHYGYHILQYVKDITPAGEVPYDTVKDKARANTLEEKQQKAYDDLLTKWGKEDKIDRYFDVLNP